MSEESAARAALRKLRPPNPLQPLIRPTGTASELGTKPGLLARQRIRVLVHRRMVLASPEIEDNQYQPASLDLRLGPKAYRVRASFLPGKGKTVEQKLGELKYDQIDLTEGAVLERGCVYVVELMESLQLPEIISAIANPKSSTGRLDVFTRLISDESEVFDTVRGGYRGRLYAEISPCSFSIRVRRGSKLNQLRFRLRNPNQPETGDFDLSDKELVALHNRTPLVDGTLNLRNGLILSVDLKRASDSPVGYKAQRYTGVIDIDEVAKYDPGDFWDPIFLREPTLVLDPHQFYILASKEHVHVPPDVAAEMVPIDPMMGEFRVHYAGFFDPGFGFTEHGHPGSRAVLEVRSHEVPFVLEDGQAIGRLRYEEVPEKPDSLYGQIGTSSYQGQGLRLSKHFHMG
jgi:dCTP deaminase